MSDEWGDGHPKADSREIELGDTGHPKQEPDTLGYEIEDKENRMLNKGENVLE